MIGLSLSFCIADLIEGRVAFQNVEKIISGTRCQTEEQFENVLASYSRTYWKRNVDLAVGIARHLWREGKIEQPRVNDEAPYWYPSGRHWVESIEALDNLERAW